MTVKTLVATPDPEQPPPRWLTGRPWPTTSNAPYSVTVSSAVGRWVFMINNPGVDTRYKAPPQ